MEKPLFEHLYIKLFLADLRGGIFGYLGSLCADIIEDEKKNDKDYVFISFF